MPSRAALLPELSPWQDEAVDQGLGVRLALASYRLSQPLSQALRELGRGLDRLAGPLPVGDCLAGVFMLTVALLLR